MILYFSPFFRIIVYRLFISFSRNYKHRINLFYILSSYNAITFLFILTPISQYLSSDSNSYKKVSHYPWRIFDNTALSSASAHSSSFHISVSNRRSGFFGIS